MLLSALSRSVEHTLRPTVGRGLVRVLLVDEEELMLEGLRRLLSGHSDIRVVGHACSVRAALEMLARLSCDLVLLPARLQGTCRFLAALKPMKTCPRALVTSTSPQGDDLDEVMRSGAHGYLSRSATVADLLTAVRYVGSGEMYIHPHLAGALARRLRTPPAAAGLLCAPLTGREREILELVCEGFSNRQIGASLFLTENTIKTHLKSLYRKLNVRGRTNAMKWAVDVGMVQVGQRQVPA